MINILLVKKNFQSSLSIINLITSINTSTKLYKTINDNNKINIIVSQHKIDIVIIEYEMFKELNIKEINKIDKKIKHMIIISDTKINTIFNHKYIYCPTKTLFVTLSNIINNITITHTYNENVIKNKIIDELKYLGYNLSYYGTKYLIEVIYYMYNNYDYFDENHIQDIYPLLAEKYNKSINTIKCNITRANSMMFTDCEELKLTNYLGCCSLPKCGSRLVIQSILRKIKL